MNFADRRARVLDEIAAACARHGRAPSEVTLLAVSKTRPAESVREALAAGHGDFGENRVQELTAKAAELASADPAPAWQLIGSLQTNKVGQLLETPGLTLVHSVDRPKVADALNRHRAERGADPLDVLLQVEATGDPGKHGVTEAALPALAERVVHACPHLRLRGLMGMGPLEGDPRPVFDRIAELRARLAADLGCELPVLSLGMSRDLESAIGAGSTLVRVGTALFGPR